VTTFEPLSVLVFAGRGGGRALDTAIELSHTHNARLTILVREPMPSPFACLVAGGESIRPLLALEAQRALREAFERVPAGLPVTGRVRRGSSLRVLHQELREGAHDLVVLPARAHGLLTGWEAHRAVRRILPADRPTLLLVPPARDDASASVSLSLVRS
jgi:hypothetical protein